LDVGVHDLAIFYFPVVETADISKNIGIAIPVDIKTVPELSKIIERPSNSRFQEAPVNLRTSSGSVPTRFDFRRIIGYGFLMIDHFVFKIMWQRLDYGLPGFQSNPVSFDEPGFKLFDHFYLAGR